MAQIVKDHKSKMKQYKKDLNATKLEEDNSDDGKVIFYVWKSVI